MGSAVAGGFGIARAIEALAAPLAGGLADKFSAGKVTQMGAALVTLSFALMFMLPLLPSTRSVGADCPVGDWL